jgi:predicted nicotinamide N-methyase
LRGKRVLEIGTASGFLCFTMERMGAEMVAYDLSGGQDWDIVPYAGLDYAGCLSDRRKLIQRLKRNRVRDSGGHRGV